MTSPRVTVVVPTFNRNDFLRRALRSIISQTFTDFEVIVIDDCSPQEALVVVREFHDSRISYLRNDKNQGEALSRNTGILAAKGIYVAFLDDDDEWLPEKLQLQVAFMDRSDDQTGGVFTKFAWMNAEDGSFLRYRFPNATGKIPTGREEVHKALLISNFIGTPSTVLLRKRCLDESGLFDKNIVYGEDHDLWLRISERYSFEYIDQTLVRCYVHPNRISSNLDVIIQGQQAMMQKYPPTKPEHREYHSRKYYVIGERYCLARDMKQGRRMFLNSIRQYPFYWRSYLELGASLFGYSSYLKWRNFRCKTASFVRSRKDS